MGWHLFGYWVSLLLPSVTVREAHLLSDICVHRGDSLSAGNQVGDSVNCPYHGWLFGADGICTHIPARPHLRIPAKARIDAYPTLTSASDRHQSRPSGAFGPTVLSVAHCKEYK
jgi:nitrite reductase/ring-hydroxylating ferredoxin subunit